MRAAAGFIATVLVLGSVTACSSSSSPKNSAAPSSASFTGNAKTMPNVIGKKLDVAEDAIKSAGGDPDKIKELGGGKLGIVVKSNWTVCSQSPKAGEALPTTPQLTVERSCTDTSPAPSASSASGGSGTPTTLTVKNSSDLAALLKVGDGCDADVNTFATKYAGRDIEFDGSVSAYTPHADQYDIRHDILIGVGDKGVNTAIGPNFQFQNVSDSDLHLTGGKSLMADDKLHIVAEVGDYSGVNSCLLQLIPVSTSVR